MVDVDPAWISADRAVLCVGVSQWIAMIGGLVIALMPNSLIQLLDFTEDSAQMMRYLWNATLRDHLAGNLQTLIDEIVKDPGIRRIHLVGFSFGSLVVLDTMFPIGVVAAPALGRVTTVTTIGCPLDMLAMMVPQYQSAFHPVGARPRPIQPGRGPPPQIGEHAEADEHAEKELEDLHRAFRASTTSYERASNRSDRDHGGRRYAQCSAELSLRPCHLPQSRADIELVNIHHIERAGAAGSADSEHRG